MFDEFFDLVQFLAADLARLEQVADRVGHAPLKEPLDKMPSHAARHLLRRDGGAIEKGAARLAMGDQAARLHFAQHGGDGGVGQFAFGLQGGVDLGHRAFAALPERLKDAQLEVAEAMVLNGIYHNDRSNTTQVVKCQGKFSQKTNLLAAQASGYIGPLNFMADIANKYTDNVTGKYYVDNQCIDCDLCRETAPNNFKRNDDGGFSFVCKQPATPEEEAQCKEAQEGCPVEAIGANG